MVARRKAEPYKRKTDNELRGRPPTAKDEVTSTLLATAEATMSQLAQLFETDAKTLPKRLKGCIPKTQRNGYNVYSIREAASFLVTPGLEIEEFIRQMSPQEMHPLLTKEFWNGQRSRLEYEIKLGMHWPTSEVVSFVGELMNTMRMTLLLVTDDVHREESLTDGQAKVFQRITDAAIETMKKTVTEKFKDYHANSAASGSPPQRVIEQRPAGRDDVDDSVDDGNILAAEEDEEIDI